MNRFRDALIIGLLLVVALAPLVAQVGPGISAELAAELTRIDELIRLDQFDAALSALDAFRPRATGGALQYELHWRQSAAVLGTGDLAIDAGRPADALLPIFERGESSADQAIAAFPGGARGYYWKAANIGKWGTAKGVLNSLMRAAPMRDQLVLAIERDPNFADAYFVLGQLHAKVPGVISFGDVNAAVSMARLSVELMEAELKAGTREHLNEAFYIQLASHLISRNWNQRRRDSQQAGKAAAHRAATTPLARAAAYEGTVRLTPRDDRVEARAILNDMIARLERFGARTAAQERRLKEARELLSGLR